MKAVTDLFFPSLDCLTLRVRPLVDGESLGPERTRSIRVKRGLWPMANVRDVAEGADRLLTFCGADTAPRNPTGVEIVFIAWAPVEDLPGRPHRLRLVEASVAKRQ